MPHKCAGCGKEFSEARSFINGCPECGSRKFIYIVLKQEKKIQNPDYDEDKIADKFLSDPIECINILEPGRYNLNLTKLAASDDLVVRLGNDDTYRLDLHSMVRKKKRERS